MKMISLRRQELILNVLPAAVHLNLYIFSVRLTTAITALCEGHLPKMQAEEAQIKSNRLFKVSARKSRRKRMLEREGI